MLVLVRACAGRKRPEDTPEVPAGDWWNLFFIHQNRSTHGGASKSAVSPCAGPPSQRPPVRVPPRSASLCSLPPPDALTRDRPGGGGGGRRAALLPQWLDFVVWGHEHECLVDPFRPRSDNGTWSGAATLRGSRAGTVIRLSLRYDTGIPAPGQ